MVWKYWPERELQQELERRNPGLLDRLETIIPALEPGGTAHADLFLKANLIRLMQAFVSADIFASSKYMRQCLNRLPPDVMHELADSLGIDAGLEFDAQRVAILRKRWSPGEFTQSFIRFFGLPDRFLPSGEQETTSGERLLPATMDLPQEFTTAYKPLKDYQSQVYFSCMEALRAPRSRFIVQMPTGSGKTRTAMEIITSVLRDEPEGAAVVWLAHSQELCDQAYQCFVETWVHVANKPVQTIKLWGDIGSPAISADSTFWVCGLAKVRNWLRHKAEDGKRLSEALTLLVFDEAHMALAPTYKEAIQNLLGRNSRLIGLSATPGRSDDDQTQALSDLFFQRIVRITLGEDRSELALLRERGVLAETQSDPLVTNITYEVTDKERRYIEERYDYPPGFLAEIGADDVRNIEILRRILSEARSGKSILFFACSVEHSRFIAAMLMYMSVSSGHIDGDTDKRTRAGLLASFRRGETQIICNYGILSTGFDAPNTDVVFIARPTASVVLYSQMIGRGLRGPAIGGTETCKLIDVKDNIIGFGDQDRVYEFFADYWH